MSKRIKQKKEQIQKLERRIKEDTERLKSLTEELKQLEANEVLILMQANKMSLEDVNQLIQAQAVNQKQKEETDQ